MTWYYWIDAQGRGHLAEPQSGMDGGFDGLVYAFWDWRWMAQGQ